MLLVWLSYVLSLLESGPNLPCVIVLSSQIGDDDWL